MDWGSFVIDKNKRVFLNGQEVKNVASVEMIDIQPTELTRVVLTVYVNDVDVKFKALTDTSE